MPGSAGIGPAGRWGATTMTQTEGLRVLVVEDDADGADSTAMLLKFWGHQPAVARDAGAAMEQARACWPDVVLLDLGLPAVSGYDVARAMKAESGGRAPLIV